MSLSALVPGSQPAAFDVQDTDLAHDVIGRYVCNTWAEVAAADANGAYPFDAVVIGAGMFGAYAAEKLFRYGAGLALRVLVLDAGAFLLPSHIQNLPQRLGGRIGGADNLRTRDTGTQNVIWGMPWISTDQIANPGFPGLAYCIGGRSLFWGGWSPRLTPADLANWPTEISSYLSKTAGGVHAYALTEREIGVEPSTDYIVQAQLYTKLLEAFNGARAGLAEVTDVGEAPLAVQGASPGPGLFSFDKYSSAPFIIDAIRDDAASNSSHGDVSRRMFLVPRAQVVRLQIADGAVRKIDVRVNGQTQSLALKPECAVVLANGTIEATRLALESLGIGSTRFGAPRVGNLMAHTRSNITVRIKRAALGLSPAPNDLETVALLVRGTAAGRRFHLQVTAAALAGPDPEKNMWSMVPDIELLGSMLANQDREWVSVTLRGIGEMEDDRSLDPDPQRSWIDLSTETDRWGVRRAYVHLVPSATDGAVWDAMDETAFTLALRIAKGRANIEYWNKARNAWQPERPSADAPEGRYWRDGIGTTHHEAGTLFMGAPGSSITDAEGRFHTVRNAYVAGPALFPTLGSANPSLTAFALTRKTAQAIVTRARPAADASFTPLSLSPNDWRMVRMPNTSARVRHHGQVLETIDAYGLYWYVKEQFSNFRLRLQWRVARRDDNSGVYIRIPPPDGADPLGAADRDGHEIQIDERGYDSAANTEGHAKKLTGAIYDLQAPSAPASKPVGEWNSYLIEAVGPEIRVTLNGRLVNVFQSDRRSVGHIAIQAHHFTSRVQFRGVEVQTLP
jgi:choline dehydrogenase-like flavoprotein